MKVFKVHLSCCSNRREFYLVNKSTHLITAPLITVTVVVTDVPQAAWPNSSESLRKVMAWTWFSPGASWSVCCFVSMCGYVQCGPNIYSTVYSTYCICMFDSEGWCVASWTGICEGPIQPYKITWKGWMGLTQQPRQVNSVLMGREGFCSVNVRWLSMLLQ